MGHYASFGLDTFLEGALDLVRSQSGLDDLICTDSISYGVTPGQSSSTSHILSACVCASAGPIYLVYGADYLACSLWDYSGVMVDPKRSLVLGWGCASAYQCQASPGCTPSSVSFDLCSHSSQVGRVAGASGGTGGVFGGRVCSSTKLDL